MMNIIAIGGFPRSGTRQFADIMNGHPSCVIQGEIENDSLTALANLAFETDIKLLANDRTQKAYFSRRIRFVLETYRMVSKSSSEPIQWDFSKKNLGFKKPYVEHFYDELDSLFSPSVDRIKVFICLRDLEKNFLSLNSAFGYSIKKFKAGIIKTDKSLIAMSKNGFFDVYPLYLDEFLQEEPETKGDWLVDKVFSKLNLDVLPEDAVQIYNRTVNRNRTPSEKRRSAMTDAERKNLFGDRSFMRHVASIEARMGVTLR